MSTAGSILIALSGEERDLFAAVAAELGANALLAGDRATCVKLTAEHRPPVAVIDLSPTDGHGGGALADVLRQTSDTICPLIIGGDSERQFIEGTMAGDLYLPRPVSREMARLALRTLLARHAVRNTGRHHRTREKADTARHSAMDTIARRLSSARTPGQIGEILKGFLADVLPFDCYAFCPAPVEDLLTPRIYLGDAVTPARLAEVTDQLADLAREEFELLPDSPTSSTVYGQTRDDGLPASGQPLHVMRWPLCSADGETVGLAMVFRETPFNLPAPVAQVCKELMNAAGMWLAGLVDDRRNQIQLLHAIGDAQHEGMIWMETRKHFTVVNRPARRLLGLPEGTTIPREQLLERLQAVGLYEDFFGNTARSRDVILKAASLPGTNEHHRVELLRVRTPRGVVRGVFLLFRSMGQDGKNGSELMEFSHDLRVPLNAILGYADVLRTGGDGPVNDEQAAHLQCIVDACRTIDGLLEYARANREAGRRPVKRPVDTRELLEAVARDFEPDARQRNIRTRIVTEDDASYLYVDQTQMRLAMSNVLSNAMRHSPDNGTITLHARRAPQDGQKPAPPLTESTFAGVAGTAGTAGAAPEAAVVTTSTPADRARRTTTRLRRGFIELLCIDEGPGIPPAEHERIFERFVQGDPSTAGTHGLGLAIAREIVNAHRGTIVVESDPAKGAGTTFRIRIPGGYDIETETSVGGS